MQKEKELRRFIEEEPIYNNITGCFKKIAFKNYFYMLLTNQEL